MTTLTDFDKLYHIPDFPFAVYSSLTLVAQAQKIAARCERAFIFFRDIFGVNPKFTLLVLSSDDWATYTPQQPVGMPHFDTDKLVVAGETNDFWQSVVPQRENISSELFKAVQNVYGQPDGTIDVSPFFHLLAIHELGHAFHVQAPSQFPRLWLMETFANLCLHTYVAVNEPELLPVLETLPQVFVDAGKDLTSYRSLKDFEMHYMNMHPANYVWYQGQFHFLAKQAFDLRGMEALSSLWKTFILSDAQLNTILRKEIHPDLAKMVENWPGTDKATSTS